MLVLITIHYLYSKSTVNSSQMLNLKLQTSFNKTSEKWPLLIQSPNTCQVRYLHSFPNSYQMNLMISMMNLTGIKQALLFKGTLSCIYLSTTQIQGLGIGHQECRPGVKVLCTKMRTRLLISVKLIMLTIRNS